MAGRPARQARRRRWQSAPAALFAIRPRCAREAPAPPPSRQSQRETEPTAPGAGRLRRASWQDRSIQCDVALEARDFLLVHVFADLAPELLDCFVGPVFLELAEHPLSH